MLFFCVVFATGNMRHKLAYCPLQIEHIAIDYIAMDQVSYIIEHSPFGPLHPSPCFLLPAKLLRALFNYFNVCSEKATQGAICRFLNQSSIVYSPKFRPKFRWPKGQQPKGKVRNPKRPKVRFSAETEKRPKSPKFRPKSILPDRKTEPRYY